MKLIIVDCRISKKNEEKLKLMEFDIIKTPVCENLYEAINAHADITGFYLGDYKFLSSPNTYDYYAKKLEKYSIEVLKGDYKLDTKYPKDVAYNLNITGENVIANLNYADPKLLQELKNRNYNFLHINQGYANCSICTIDENSIITGDAGIKKQLKNTEIDILCEDFSDIKLETMSCGFIGGSSFTYNETVFFFGDIKTIKNGYKVEQFIKSKNQKIVNLSDDSLYDYGSCFIIE